MIYFGSNDNHQDIVDERVRLLKLGKNAIHSSLEFGQYCCQPVEPRFEAVSTRILPLITGKLHCTFVSALRAIDRRHELNPWLKQIYPTVFSR